MSKKLAPGIAVIANSTNWVEWFNVTTKERVRLNKEILLFVISIRDGNATFLSHTGHIMRVYTRGVDLRMCLEQGFVKVLTYATE